jgi:Aconitase C-terminal domain
VAEFAFESIDGTYAKRAKASRDRGERHIIVAGSNYGQGSSRENAAVAPRFLGLQVVIAKSFAAHPLAKSRQLRGIATPSQLESAWPHPIPAMRAGSAIYRQAIIRSAIFSWTRWSNRPSARSASPMR